MEKHSRILIINIVVLFIFPEIKAHISSAEQCDLSRGEWIPESGDPPYDATCKFIDRRQNCLLNGRPDRGYLHWRWKPHGCDLPLFIPKKFLDAMRDKAFAFVGDSITRNQKESLLCLLFKVERPILVYGSVSTLTNTWYFPSYNFTLAAIWSPFLLQTNASGMPDERTEVNLNVLDENWVDKYSNFDYVLIGIGAWFQAPKPHENGMELAPNHLYRRALELTFHFVAESSHKPFVIYRIHTPNHFEPGRWFENGYCNRTEPFEEGEFAGAVEDREVEATAREEFAEAATEADNMEMLDVYHLSLLRPDGHPDKYRPTGRDKHDCLHWCLPGAIDVWNDLLMEMVMRNGKNLRQSS